MADKRKQTTVSAETAEERQTNSHRHHGSSGHHNHEHRHHSHHSGHHSGHHSHHNSNAGSVAFIPTQSKKPSLIKQVSKYSKSNKKPENTAAYTIKRIIYLIIILTVFIFVSFKVGSMFFDSENSTSAFTLRKSDHLKIINAELQKQVDELTNELNRYKEIYGELPE